MSIGVSTPRNCSVFAALRVPFMAFLGVVLGACAGGSQVNLENPLERQLNWFSFLNGDDIRATCGPGSNDRARLIYNGRYDDQVRVYEVHQRTGPAVLDVHVFTGLRLGGGYTPLDLNDLLRGRPRTERIGEAGADALWRAVADSGAFADPPRGLWLDSDDLHWIAVGCRDGAVFFNAWQHPSPRFDALAFPDVLRRYDPSDVPWPRLDAPPRPLQPVEDEGTRPGYRLQVGTGGLRL